MACLIRRSASATKAPRLCHSRRSSAAWSRPAPYARISDGPLSQQRAHALRHESGTLPSPPSLKQLSRAFETRGIDSMLQLVDDRNAWEGCAVVLSAMRQRQQQPIARPVPGEIGTTSSTGQPAAGADSTLIALCESLVWLCRFRSTRDLGQGGLLRQLLDSFHAGSANADSGALSAGERRLLLHTVLRMVQAVPVDAAEPEETRTLVALFQELARVPRKHSASGPRQVAAAATSAAASSSSKLSSSATGNAFIVQPAAGLAAQQQQQQQQQAAASRLEESLSTGDTAVANAELEQLRHSRYALQAHLQQLQAAAATQAAAQGAELRRLQQQLAQLQAQSPQQEQQQHPPAQGSKAQTSGSSLPAEAAASQSSGIASSLSGLQVQAGTKAETDHASGMVEVAGVDALEALLQSVAARGGQAEAGSSVSSKAPASGFAVVGAGAGVGADDVEAAPAAAKRALQLQAVAIGGGGAALVKAAKVDIPVEGFIEAVEAGDAVELGRMLAANATDINAIDEVLLTPLHYAASLGDAACVAVLLQHGADPNALDQIGDTPLHLALCGGASIAVVELLLKGGADPCATNHGGWTLLHTAAASDHRAAVELLLSWGANVHATTKAGDTALHLAARSGALACVELLLGHGAMPQALNQEGKTAQDVADYDCMQLLLTLSKS